MRSIWLLYSFCIFVLSIFASLEAENGENLVLSSSMSNQFYVKGLISRKKLIPLGNCNLSLTDRISTVSYFNLICPNGSRKDLIHFGFRNNMATTDTIQIVSLKKIGSRELLEIKFIESNTQPMYPSNEIPIISNLDVFLELYNIPSDKISSLEGMEIFFNKKCPLKYLGFNHDFYWDNTTFHEFELTCLTLLRKSKVIQIQGDDLGRIPLNNSLASELEPGKLYLARVYLDRWKGESLVWRNPILYSYEK